MLFAEFLFHFPATLLAILETLYGWVSLTSRASLFDRLAFTDEAIDMPGMNRIFRKSKANGRPFDDAAFEKRDHAQHQIGRFGGSAQHAIVPLWDRHVTDFAAP